MVLSGISLLDIIVSTAYIALIIFLFSLISKLITNANIKKYFMPFVIVKIIASILFVLIHVYHYQGGDTFLYFSGANFFVEITMRNPEHILTYFFNSFEHINNFAITENFDAYSFMQGKDTLFMSRLLAIFCLLGFKQFMATTILFAIFCSLGHWLIFTTLCKIYPKLHKYFAMGTLFFPSVVLWSSGLLKDSIVLSAVGLIFYATLRLTQQRGSITSILYIVISVYICIFLKPYILYLFLPIMLYWAQGLLKKRLKGSVLYFIFTPAIILSVVVGGYFLITEISAEAGKYNLSNLENVAKGFHSWHSYLAETRDQSGYTLGNIEYTFIGILKKVPEAIFVTFFRPFPFFDTRNAATWFEAIQSFALLMISFYVFFKTGVINSLKIVFTNKTVLAFLLFSLAFGFAVGFTSYNFGALSRYKIPALPFYTAALAIIYLEGKNRKAKKLRV